MDNKKGSNYMQKAIQKASKLIELLTKQNNQLKQQNLNLLSQLENLCQIQQQLNQKMQILKQSQRLLQQKQVKIGELLNQINILENKVNEKGNKNKQLHQKLGQYAAKNQELTKNLQKQRKKNLSLQNQNQYLLKTFNAHQLKENQFQNYCNMAEEQFIKQMLMVDRTKQAFARRCDELKNENTLLKNEVYALNQRVKQLSKSQAAYLQTLQTLTLTQKQIKRTSDALNYIIESTLRIKPQNSLQQKVQQIKNYINYRLQHIQNLIKPIIDCLEADANSNEDPFSFRIREIRDLDSLNSFVNRLGAYLGQLLK